MDSLAHFFSSDEEEEEVQKRNLITIRQSIRQHSNPFSLADSQFVRNFRLSKEAFRYLLEEMRVHIITKHNTCVSLVLKLATTLRLLAEGGYQHGAGKEFHLGLAQSTVSKVFNEVIDVLEHEICSKWVRGNMTNEDKSESKLWCFEKSGFPGVIGCIDGTHIKIVAPKKDEQHLYYNRKGFYSLNAMVVCGHNMVIRCMDARQPGASHDALIWNTSDLRELLKLKFDGGEKNSWILGM